jgi:hypothetical protein
MSSGILAAVAETQSQSGVPAFLENNFSLPVSLAKSAHKAASENEQVKMRDANKASP